MGIPGSPQRPSVNPDLGKRIIDAIQKFQVKRFPPQGKDPAIQYWAKPLPDPRGGESPDPLYLFQPAETTKGQGQRSLIPGSVENFLQTCRTSDPDPQKRKQQITPGEPFEPFAKPIRFSQIPLGLVDEPDQLKQRPLLIDLLGVEGIPNSGGPLLLVGAQGYGKGTALRTLALWLAMRFTPDEARCVVIDPGGDLKMFSGLRIFKDGKSCYTNAETEQQCSQACEQFEQLVEEQKHRFDSQSRADRAFSLLRVEYDPAPMCLLIVAQHDAVAANEKMKTSLNRAMELALSSREYGVSAVVTTTTYRVSAFAALTEAMAVGFKNRIVLNCDDSSRQLLLQSLPARSRQAEEIEGRGFALVPREKPRWAQLALPVPGLLRSDQDKTISDMLSQMTSRPGYNGWY